MKRVLVTGAGGFIGHCLVERLVREGLQVRAVLRPQAPHHNHASTGRVEVFVGDVRDAQAMRKAAVNVDTIFHLAGKVHALSERAQDDAEYMATNVEGTRHVLEASVAGGAEGFVYFSSVKAMGEGTSDCQNESDESLPHTAYGRSKLAAERLVGDYSRQGGLHAVCLRLPLVYGRGSMGNLTQMVSAIDRGFFPPLPEVGNRRSMVHVGDVVEAALLAARSPNAHGKAYIVTDGVAYSTRMLYEMICKALGRRVPRWHVPVGMLTTLGKFGDIVGRLTGRRWVVDSDMVDKLVGSAWYSSDLISKELGFYPTQTFERAAGDMVAEYRKGKR